MTSRWCLPGSEAIAREQHHDRAQKIHASKGYVWRCSFLIQWVVEIARGQLTVCRRNSCKPLRHRPLTLTANNYCIHEDNQVSALSLYADHLAFCCIELNMR
jgi:hypothetical protein